MASGGFSGGDDQDRLLDEATAVVKEQAFYMKRAMDNDNLREALKHASNLICELRTSLLSPKNYYELYMQVFQEMQHIGAFFSDKSRHNRKMLDLYESVQHAGNILPRLYLLATVGASYIKSKEAPAKEILKDMGVGAWMARKKLVSTCRVLEKLRIVCGVSTNKQELVKVLHSSAFQDSLRTMCGELKVNVDLAPLGCLTVMNAEIG